MEIHLDHHVAVRVSDIDAGIRFYEHALGAKLVAGPAERGGPYIEEVFGPGAIARVCQLGCSTPRKDSRSRWRSGL